PRICVKTRIHLTKATGMRTIPQFVFTSPFSLSDATLIVEEKKIYANKQYLSSVSTKLRSMFDENVSGNHNEIILNGVKYEDFIEFLRWIYPSAVKNFEEDALSRVVVLAKRFNVLFVVDQIARYLRGTEKDFFLLKFILHFGYASHLQFGNCLEDEMIWVTNLKPIYKQVEDNAAYEEMEDDKAREMFEWM
ncbi:hypothetical protein PMAYCL1PPCAC_25316, partial [Pristionchus mayeri]